MATPVDPRLFDKPQAAQYLSVSLDTIDRLIQVGEIPTVQLPVQRDRKSGRGAAGLCRRKLIDRQDLDRLIDAWKESAT